MKKTKVGIIGCGNISGLYCKGVQRFRNLDLIACADIDLSRAQAKAKEFNIPIACSTEKLLDNDDMELVINLTIPKVHAEVSLAALKAGKHVYSEKPLAVTREDGQKILSTAKSKKLRVGCAPDTFLGGGIQTCRKLIQDGWIGEPVAATAFMLNHGPEHWHPDPDFVYQPGAGPMFDMGPYYLTAMINLIGPIRRVTGAARITFPERLITSQPKYGTKIKVNTPTHVAGIIEFKNNAIATLVTSNDVWAAEVPRIEIYGTTGSLSVPDPNTFGGPVKAKRGREQNWSEMPLAFHYGEQSRGLGTADMASAIELNRPHRANGEMAYHVLDAMHSFLEAAKSGKHIELSSTCAQPEPLPLNLIEGMVEPQ